YLRQYEFYRMYDIDFSKVEFYKIISSELGYVILIELGLFLGLTFFEFRALVIVILILMIFVPLFNSTKLNSHFVLMAYMIYPMIMDSIQLSNFIAFFFLLHAIK